MPSTEKDLELRAFRVNAPAPQALRALLFALQSNETEVFYAIRSRVKPVNKIIAKVIKKRTDDPINKANYEPEDITDVVGIRVVTLFREDVIDALKIFLRMIKHEGIYSSNSPFVKNELKEALVYTTTPVGDPEAIIGRLRSVFEAAMFPLKDDDIKQVETGYSSIHLVAFCNISHDETVAKVPVEIQIRTVFEDAWGEIDHKLRYSVNKGRGQPRDSLLESWQPHLNVLKTFADGCGQYAGIIKNQAIDSQTKPPYYSSPFVPMDDVGDAFKQMGEIPKSLLDTFSEAFGKRQAALKLRDEASTDDDGQRLSDALIEAATAFERALQIIIVSEFKSTRGRGAAIFYGNMEKAFCLLSTGNKSFIDQALQIYSEMQEKFPDSVVVFYRHAQALAGVGEFDSAEAKYAKADKLLGKDKELPPDHWLRSALPRRWGFLHWHRSLLCAQDEIGITKRLALLIEAYKCTERAFSLSEAGTPAQIMSANNLVYYAVEYVGLLPSGHDAKLGEEDIRRYLSTLESAINLATASRKELNRLDTLCRAYIQLGAADKAVLAAERIEHLLSGSDPAIHSREPNSYYAVTSHLNDEERDILDHALWVLRKYGPGPDRPEPVG